MSIDINSWPRESVEYFIFAFQSDLTATEYILKYQVDYVEVYCDRCVYL